jgi:hypothetical protein
MAWARAPKEVTRREADGVAPESADVPRETALSKNVTVPVALAGAVAARVTELPTWMLAALAVRNVV